MVKITNENIENLKQGDLIVEYPTSGEHVDEVNIDDIEEPRVMEVLEAHFDRIDLVFPDTKNPVLAGGMIVEIGPLNKYKDELIKENKWWLYSK